MNNRTEFLVIKDLEVTTQHVVHGYNNSGVFQSYESFDVSGNSSDMRTAAEQREVQKKLLLSGTIRNPVLNDCPSFDADRNARHRMYQVNRSLMHVQELRRASGAADTAEDRLLDQTIAMRINELGYVETAALLAQGGLDSTARANVGQMLKQAGRQIYGMPSVARAEALFGERLTLAETYGSTSGHPLADIAYQLVGSTAFQPNKIQEFPKAMQPETAAYYRQMVHDICQGAIDYSLQEIGVKDSYSVEEMTALIFRHMQFKGLDEEGWTSDLVEDRSMCAAKMAGLVIEIGAERPKSQLTHAAVIKSGTHEILHAERQANGKHLGDGLAEFGLPGYSMFEEPFVEAVAVLVEGIPKLGGDAYILGIALAAGYDGTERDFRDSFEMAWRFGLIKNFKSDKLMQSQIETARKNAYNSQVRIWRGMPTDIPGCIFPKDRAYDNADVLAYLENDGNMRPRRDFMRLLEAKYNPLDSAHDAYIRSLTI